MVRSIVAAAAMLVALLASDAARAEPLICFGDSQTAGVGVDDPSLTFCSRMALATGRTPINRGEPGETSRDLRARVVRDVLDEPGPACVTLMIGANDARIDPDPGATMFDYSQPWMAPQPSIRGITVGETQANIEALITTIRAAGKDVTLMTMWAPGNTANLLQTAFYVDATKAAAVETGTPLLDAYGIFLRRWFASKEWNIVSGDQYDLWALYVGPGIFHPSAEGHREIAALCDLPQNQTACACRKP